jgi:hypothetical protein
MASARGLQHPRPFTEVRCGRLYTLATTVQGELWRWATGWPQLDSTARGLACHPVASISDHVTSLQLRRPTRLCRASPRGAGASFGFGCSDAGFAVSMEPPSDDSNNRQLKLHTFEDIRVHAHTDGRRQLCTSTYVL